MMTVYRKPSFQAVALSVAITSFFLVSCNGGDLSTNYVHDWESWKTTTTQKLNYPIPGHMDNYRKIYINESGEQVKKDIVEGRSRYEYPAGTIIAKEVFKGQDYKEGDEPFQITAMVKAPDDPRSQAGWLWIVKDMTTDSETVLTDEFCLTCHANANEGHPYGDENPNSEFRDYVFFPYDVSAVVGPQHQ